MHKGPIPLQAKDGYADQPPVYQNVRQAPEQYSDYGTVQVTDGGHSRHVHHEDADPQYSKRKSAWEVEIDRNRSSNINSSLSAATAQLALQQQYPKAPMAPPPQQQQQQQPPVPPPVRTEKEKMLNEEHYLPFSPQLVDEREQCKAALWRFNNATNPAVGVSRAERTRLFRAVLEPAHTPASRASSANPIGSLGNDVEIEAPFMCDYGYNINIGDEVVIGHGCTILDPCEVVIGARTVLGPNVNIYGNTMSTDPRSRKGSAGPAIGQRVFIDEDVFVGGGVTILPGLKVGKGSTIGAGSVVTRDVPPFTVVAGNPTRVKRGIWRDRPN
ncbi:hypothetical protein H2199_004890 [Coniosporium tulheliwenetii]|uniref:Uncharacterized protein n=1 Tax=Coniosporium tulheliwenetii TaxID=3383036 RepID=A0ACC2Z552_9PEZI|nr:hypothetical protein H2199_004890 [Cladosporium sp. JES 115]